jgi:hypothetical protein
VGVAVGDGASALPQATIAKAKRKLAARRAPVFKGALLSLPACLPDRRAGRQACLAQDRREAALEQEMWCFRA